MRESNPLATTRIRNGRLIFTEGTITKRYEVTSDLNIRETLSASRARNLQTIYTPDMEEI
jgi:hypothetical protein